MPHVMACRQVLCKTEAVPGRCVTVLERLPDRTSIQWQQLESRDFHSLTVSVLELLCFYH